MHLSEWMRLNDVTDESLGALVDVDRVTISRIRRGINRPSWDLASRLKAATGGAVTADDYLLKQEAAE